MMTEEEFAELKSDLEITNNLLEDLQQEYIRETGRRWVPPLYLKTREKKEV